MHKVVYQLALCSDSKPQYYLEGKCGKTSKHTPMFQSK